MKYAPWTLEQALELVRRIEPVLLGAGYAVGLTGGVLLRGHSKKDLDLIVYPRDSTEQDFTRLVDALAACGLRRRYHSRDILMIWKRLGSKDEKTVELWTFGAQRVDIFFLS